MIIVDANDSAGIVMEEHVQVSAGDNFISARSITHHSMAAITYANEMLGPRLHQTVTQIIAIIDNNRLFFK